MEIKYKINSRLLLLAMLGAIMTCTSYLMFVYNPVQFLIKKMVTLDPGTIFLRIWSTPPHEVFIDMYIFNVTNTEEFLSGREKMNLVQKGPYVFQETLRNENATFHENGTMTFYPKRHLHFRLDKSVGDPNIDIVTCLNIPLVGIMASLQDNSMFTNIAVSSISNMLGSKPFLNLTVMEYLFGYDDRLVTLANKAIPSWINFERFGIMDRLMALDNASNVVTLNNYPEMAPAGPLLNEQERNGKYHIQRWNGSPGLKQWGYVEPEGNETLESNTRCNMVEGSFEGTVFPPHMPQNQSIKLYRRAFCRPLNFKYTEDVTTSDGFLGRRYTVDDLALSSGADNPENSCFCLKGKCLRKGLSSLAPCYYDIPIAISQPHFYSADPTLLDGIDGMNPNETLHNSRFTLHPEVGIVLNCNLRIQINLDVGQTKFNARTKPFNGMVIPLFWMEMRMSEVPTTIYLLIALLFNVLPVVQVVLIYLLGLGGLAVVCGSALLALFCSQDEPNGRLSFRGDYSPIPILPQYFKPEIRLFK